MKRKLTSRANDGDRALNMPQIMDENDQQAILEGHGGIGVLCVTDFAVGERVSMRTETGEELCGTVARVKHSLEFVYVRWDDDERQKKKVRKDRLTKVPFSHSRGGVAKEEEEEQQEKNGEAGIEEGRPSVCSNSVFSIMTGDIVMNRFEVTEPLGEGGTAVVWKGVDTETGKPVAIKRIVHKLSKMLYDRELDVLYTNASNPRVPSIIGEVKDDCVVVMEYVGQKSVKDYAMPGPTNRPKILGCDSYSVATGMITALRSLHERGWAHRDVKPANFVVTDCPDAHKAANLMLVDFGLSKSFVRERKQGGDKEAWPNMVCNDEDSDKEWCIRDEAQRSGSFRGTTMYASRRAHDGMDVGRADDLM